MDTMTFSTPDRLRFVIEIGSGDIDMQTSATTTTTVHVTVRKGAEPEVRQSADGDGGTTIWITGRKTKRQDYGIAITCPDGASVEVTTGSADLVVHGEAGDIAFRAGSGDLVFDRALGDVSVKVGSGDALGAAVGGAFTMQSGSGDAQIREGVGSALTVKTASGDIVAGAVGGGVNVTTVSGDVRIASLREGDAHIRSVSGDVEVGVAAGTRVFLDLSATSGDVRSDLAPTDAPGEGTVLELHAATVSGDITVRRARG